MKKTGILLAAFVIGLAAVAATSAPPAASVPAWQTSLRASVMINGGAMMNGDHFRDSVLPAMKKHFVGCKRIALVLWASHPDDYDRMEKRLQTAFADFGEDVSATSLHHYDTKGAAKFLGEADGIFVGGGETFVLLAELWRTGQLDLIRRRVVRDGVPYFGVSAGSNIAGLVVGTTNDFPIRDLPTRAALGLLPVTINPHHPEASDQDEFKGRAGKIRGYLRFNPDETVLALGNAAMIRLHEGVCSVEVGPVWVYRAGQTTEYEPGATIAFAGAAPAAYTPERAVPPIAVECPEPAPKTAVVEIATQPAVQETAPAAAAEPADTKSIWQRLGLAKDKDEPGWRDIPPMQARVEKWVSANAFKLDNGQVWEGTESIPYELKGKKIAISARPMGAFELSVEGKSTTIRVRRIK